MLFTRFFNMFFPVFHSRSWGAILASVSGALFCASFTDPRVSLLKPHHRLGTWVRCRTLNNQTSKTFGRETTQFKNKLRRIHEVSSLSTTWKKTTPSSNLRADIPVWPLMAALTDLMRAVGFHETLFFRKLQAPKNSLCHSEDLRTISSDTTIFTGEWNLGCQVTKISGSHRLPFFTEAGRSSPWAVTRAVCAAGWGQPSPFRAIRPTHGANAPINALEQPDCVVICHENSYFEPLDKHSDYLFVLSFR